MANKIVIHNKTVAPEIIAGPPSGISEYDVPIMQRWLEADGVRYWIEAADKYHRESEYIVKDERDGSTVGMFFTLDEIREWAGR